MLRIVLAIAVTLTLWAIPTYPRDRVKSTYPGPSIKHTDSLEKGIELCKKAHVLSFHQHTNRMLFPEMLSTMIEEAKKDGYCYGYWGKGNTEGNHSFICYGVTWEGGTEIDLNLTCHDEWSRSKKNYGKWLDENYPDEFI